MTFYKEIRSPMSETEELYLFEEDKDLVRRYGFHPSFGGKWILYVGLGSMDSMWTKCCRLYRREQFTGIKSIKCSTAKYNHRQSTTKMGVIIFHCGPYSDTANILSYGRNIVEKLSYFNKAGHIPYKSDFQTAQGTRATGNSTNSMYWIPVPKARTSNSAGRGVSTTVHSRRSGDMSTTHALLDKVLRMQEDVHEATGGKLAIQLVLDETHQVLPLSGSALVPTVQTKQSRIMEFKICDVLGSGGFAIVFRAYQDMDDHEYAIKRIPLPTKKDKQDRVLREVKVLAKLNHSNVVRYYGCWQETHGTDWVRHFDEPWKQKLKDKCITESFRTPVADTATRTDTSSDYSTHTLSQLDVSSKHTRHQNTLTNDRSHGTIQNESDSDEDLLVGKEYGQYSGLSKTASSNLDESSDNYDTNTYSSNIQFEKGEGSTPTKEVSSLRSCSDYLYIQMELCDLHSLKEWLTENSVRPKQTILKYFLDIVNAVEHVHDKEMMHRDLKPSNIFFDLENKFVVKVGDFGLGTNTTEHYGTEVSGNLSVATDVVSSGTSGRDQHTQNVGTFCYMSPEQRGSSKGAYTYKVDIFSMGLILFEMLWVMRTVQEKSRTLQNVREMVFPDGFTEQYPEELALLQMMLHEDPNQRPTTRGIRAQSLLHDLQLPHYVDGIKEEEHFELVLKTDQERTNTGRGAL